MPAALTLSIWYVQIKHTLQHVSVEHKVKTE